MATLSRPVAQSHAIGIPAAVFPTTWTLSSGLVLTVLLSVTVIVAAALRLSLLASWPIFSDEDSYITAALSVQSMSVTDALMALTQMTYKPPMAPATHALLTRMGADPLLAGRGLSAAAGIVTTLLTFELGRRLGGRAVGLVAAVCYAVSPFAVFNERTTTTDPLMAALTLGATLTSLVAIERKSTAFALLAALTGALAVLAKTPAIAVATVPVVALLLRPGRTDRPIVPAAIAMFGPILCYAALMQSPIGRTLTDQNAMLMDPFAAFGQNMLDLIDTIWTYLPGGLPLVVVAGFVLALRRSPRIAMLSAVMIGVWIGPWIVLSKFAPSRYDLAAVPFLCAFAGMGFVHLPRLVNYKLGRQLAVLVAVGIVAASAATSLRMVVDHPGAPLSRLDDWQSRSGWPGGYGYGEAAALVHRVAEPGSSVAYMVDKYHVAGAGMYKSLPAGVTSLGWSEPDQPLPATTGRLYVLVDDGRDTELVNIGENNVGRVQRVLAQRPDLTVIGHFPRPGSQAGVSVLQSP